MFIPIMVVSGIGGILAIGMIVLALRIILPQSAQEHLERFQKSQGKYLEVEK